MDNEIVLEDALELLGDPDARAVLRELTDRPRSAPEVAARCDRGRATVYRRLAELEAAGIVQAEVALSASGHHCHVYHNVLAGLVASVCPDGMDGDVSVGPRR